MFIIQWQNLNTSQQSYKALKPTCKSQYIKNNYNKQKQTVTTTFNKYAFTIILTFSLSFQYAITICKQKSDHNKKILSKHVDINV
jgi:hypothetical protein